MPKKQSKTCKMAREGPKAAQKRKKWTKINPLTIKKHEKTMIFFCLKVFFKKNYANMQNMQKRVKYAKYAQKR